LVSLLGCAASRPTAYPPTAFPHPMREHLLDRAAQELSCPVASLEVTEPLGLTNRVRGCGREEKYLMCRHELLSGSELKKRAESFPALTAPDGSPVLEDEPEQVTSPKWLSGEAPEYTREALAHHIEGMMVAQCVLTTEGRLENCQILKGLPYMEKAYLASLEASRFTPATLAGKPVSIRLSDTACLRMP
jgi:Gram-negative bacterial TonB protein C-terminal